MSGFVMVPGWLREKKPSGNAMLAYINLAARGTFSPGQGTYEECRPAMSTLAKDMGVNIKTARRAVQELEELRGVVGIVGFSEDGSQLPTVYRVIFGVLTEPTFPVPNQGGGYSQIREGGTPKSGRGVLPNQGDNQEPNTKNQTPKEKPPARTRRASPRGAADVSFETWYAAYPLKRSKGAAEKAYPKALSKAAGDRRVETGEITAVDLLLAAAVSYAEDPNRNPGFTKHPTTWLNQSCWLDEPLPSIVVGRSASNRNELIEIDGMQLTRRNAEALERMKNLPIARQVSAESITGPVNGHGYLELEGAPW